MDRPSNQMPLPVSWQQQQQPQQLPICCSPHAAIPPQPQYWPAPINPPQYTYRGPNPYCAAQPYMKPQSASVTRWNMRSKIYYEILRVNGYPEDLSRCLAGQQSGARPPKAFDKALWNEANAIAATQYPEWLDEEKPEQLKKLQDLLSSFVTQRMRDEHVRDQREQKEREKAKAQSLNAHARLDVAQDSPAPSSPSFGQGHDPEDPLFTKNGNWEDENAAAAAGVKAAGDRPSRRVRLVKRKGKKQHLGEQGVIIQCLTENSMVIDQ